MAGSEIKIVQSCFVCNARADSIFCDLDDLRLAELNEMRQASVYPGGVMVFMEGDEPRGVYCICFGRVKLSTSSSDGRTIIVDIAGPGDIIGIRALLSGKSHDLTAETLEPTQLCFIRKDGFLGFLSRNGDVTLRLAQKLSDDLHEAYRGVRDVALKRSSERLAELLLRFCQTHGVVTPEGIQLRINLSLDELAEMIGTSRRTLTRVLTKFQDLKIIECQRRSITVRNRTALENSLRPENLF